MINRDFHKPRPGGQFSAADLHRLAETVEAEARVSGPGLSYGASGVAVRDIPDELWVRATSEADSFGRHSYEEVVEFYDPITGRFEWLTVQGGYQGNPVNMPLFESGGNSLAEGTVVKASRRHGDWLMCDHCCAGEGSGSGSGS